MLKKKNLLVLIAVVVLSVALNAGVAQAQAVEYTLASQADTGIGFSIPFTFGTHHGKALEARGSFIFDETTFLLGKTEFSVPLASIRTGNDQRDCHLRQALGVEYKGSSYPGRDNCEKNQLPVSGPDSIVYPEIQFTLNNIKVLEVKPSDRGGFSATAEAYGSWTIHGKTVTDQAHPVALTVSKDPSGTIRIQGTHVLNTDDFGIFVRPVLFVKVGKVVTINLDMQFQTRK